MSQWRNTPRWDVNFIKAKNLKDPNLQAKSKPTELNNRGKGVDNTRQLSESVSEFLDRLPPATTASSKIGPWIWIWNPYFRETSDSDLESYLDRCTPMLDDLMARRAQLEAENPGKVKGAVTRLYNPHQLSVTDQIYSIAKQTRVLSGKWMLFPYVEEVHRVWSKVCEATANADLGVGAKVASMDRDALSSRNAKLRLICVYTKDFSDKKDVERVLRELIRIKVVKLGTSIYYKADAMTHLDVKSDNVWGIKPSLYCSKDFVDRIKEAGHS